MSDEPVTVTDEHRDALARVIDPDSWALADDERFDKADPKAREILLRASRQIADRIVDSGLMASFVWEPREYRRARQAIIDRTSKRGYCYSVDDLLDGYFMHDPRCTYWPDGAIGGSSCIQEGRQR